jgi:UDP-glucose 4-epimerase
VRVIVTGGAGFIGSNLCFALLGAGHELLVVDDLSTGHAGNLDPRAQFRCMDILDDGLTETFQAFGPDAVVHLAAQASVVASIRDPERDRAVNAEGTHRVASAARASSAKRVLSASSAAVYGDPAELPLREESVTLPLNPYGSSKLEAEALLAAELAGSDVDFASMRFSNVYGPRQDAAGEGGVVAIFCDRVNEGVPPQINGDGQQTRDFIYVGDVVGFVVAALGTEVSLASGTAAAAPYNVSTGRATTVNELLMAVRTAASYFGPAASSPPREGDIDHSVLDPGKALSVLGWQARVDLATGIDMTWRWFAGRR